MAVGFAARRLAAADTIRHGQAGILGGWPPVAPPADRRGGGVDVRRGGGGHRPNRCRRVLPRALQTAGAVAAGAAAGGWGRRHLRRGAG